MTPSSESIDTPDTAETPSKSPPRKRPAQDLITIREDTLPDTEGLCEEELDEIYEAAKQKDYKLSELQAMTMQELMHLAGKEGVQSTSGMGKQELVFELLKARVMNAGLGWGEGVLDILPDGFGFLRSPSHCYAAGPDDIYVSPSQIRRLNLRPGHLVAGPIRPPKDGERYFALLRVEAIENGPVDELQTRVPFDDLTPLLPDERLSLDHQGCGADVRLLDLLAPMGKGQRVIVQTPPLSGRSVLLTNLARAILHNHPDVYVIMLVIDEQPEEITEMEQRTASSSMREIAASTFADPASRHISLSEIVVEKARRLVESGADVVILMDSLTALTRAYNQELQPSGKTLSNGLDAASLQKPKRFLSSAHKLQEGGSLTIVATVLTDTGSPMNDVICDQFQSKANCEIVLDEHLADLHIYPALDVFKTRTRREDSLMSDDEIKKIRNLRKQFGDSSPQEALEQLIQMIDQSESNEALLAGL